MNERRRWQGPSRATLRGPRQEDQRNDYWSSRNEIVACTRRRSGSFGCERRVRVGEGLAVPCWRIVVRVPVRVRVRAVFMCIGVRRGHCMPVGNGVRTVCDTGTGRQCIAAADCPGPGRCQPEDNCCQGADLAPGSRLRLGKPEAHGSIIQVSGAARLTQVKRGGAAACGDELRARHDMQTTATLCPRLPRPDLPLLTSQRWTTT